MSNILIGPTKINSISSPPCFQEAALGQQFLQSQSTLEMRAFSGQEFSGGQRHLTAVSKVWLPVIPCDTQHPTGCELMWELHLPLLHVCFSRKVNSSNNLTLGGCNYSPSSHPPRQSTYSEATADLCETAATSLSSSEGNIHHYQYGERKS